jgi:S-adenosylmethionine hydrolase
VPAEYRCVSFLSDLGSHDELVGVCKGVMWSLAPDLRILDLAHDLPAFDVRTAALALVRAVQYLPAGIVLAVVDPTVGSDRRALAVEVDEGLLIGPDNGILAPAVALVGGAQRVFSLDNPDYQLTAPGPTFAARDVFAAAAGHLASGVPVERLGSGIIAVSMVEAHRVVGQVWAIDRFGNVQLNIDPTELAALGAAPGVPVEVHANDQVRVAKWIDYYGAAKPSELGLLVDSSGLLSLVLDRRSAAAEYGWTVGSTVTLVPPPRRGASIPVRSEDA